MKIARLLGCERGCARVSGAGIPSRGDSGHDAAYAMLQRNLLYTGVTRGKRLVVLVGQKKAVATSRADGVGRSWAILEVLCECIMSGVTAPPWRSRLYLATSKVRDKSTESLPPPRITSPTAIGGMYCSMSLIQILLVGSIER